MTLISTASIFNGQKERRVFDQGFTIASLVFLCSRLLEASKKGRAAAVVERIWRRSKAHRVLRQRYVMRKVAYDCKAIYEKREQILRAARVLQNAWRLYIGRRIGKPSSTRKREARYKHNGPESASHQHVDIWLLR